MTRCRVTTPCSARTTMNWQRNARNMGPKVNQHHLFPPGLRQLFFYIHNQNCTA
uniref:Uncharacterized protein n=1 Tax=Anguilla anguilla TaxID=7936 RepID=A0A0E9ULF2_ANGAN